MSAPRDLAKLDDLLDSRLMAKLDSVDVVSRKIFSGKMQGERRSRRRGQSVEFADFRPYVHGDDLRFVDWNIFGRLDKLFLKMFLEEEDLSLIIAHRLERVDAGRKPRHLRLRAARGHGACVRRAREPASCVARRVRGRRGRAREQSPRASQGSRGARSGSCGASPRAAAASSRRCVSSAPVGRGVASWSSSPTSSFRGFARRASPWSRAAGSISSPMQILAPQVVDPSREGGINGDLLLVDSETGAETEVTVTPELLKVYESRA
jgi:hypothetical protein